MEYSPHGLEYTHVCGRIIGYQFNTPDGYVLSHDHTSLTPGNEINEPYVDGVSVTYGFPRQHIWTLYGGGSEDRCCETPATTFQPPSFIEKNYFCDIGNVWRDISFTTPPMWDDEANCPNDDACCAPQSGMCFNTTLTVPTIEYIEIRICADQSSGDEDTPLELVEIYVK